MELTIPDGVMDAAALNGALDSVLSGGLARVSDEQLEALHELSQAVLGTPLGQAASEAVSAIADGDLLVRHVAVLAAGIKPPLKTQSHSQGLSGAFNPLRWVEALLML